MRIVAFSFSDYTFPLSKRGAGGFSQLKGKCKRYTKHRKSTAPFSTSLHKLITICALAFKAIALIPVSSYFRTIQHKMQSPGPPSPRDRHSPLVKGGQGDLASLKEKIPPSQLRKTPRKLWKVIITFT